MVEKMLKVVAVLVLKWKARFLQIVILVKPLKNMARNSIGLSTFPHLLQKNHNGAKNLR